MFVSKPGPGIVSGKQKKEKMKKPTRSLEIQNLDSSVPS